ncbi:glycosyltransferase family 2 protein [Geobacter sp. DSM 9736]|uniref:glycosyltransferase family 2 protein n=1 Tax=Geobacter sp. DSM 9736 TaxID=1277350 RepID=UPI000B501970|nr:glycosyltransferase family 2 protein [Geobacter sp. DSM 9736]SNB46100.1 Glycosyl transferase family group 2 [Geobacter sp. DSM 9736]
MPEAGRASNGHRLERYQATRGIRGPWNLEGTAATGFDGVVAIPALAESKYLFDTLSSLAGNPPDILNRFLVMVVVNHRADAPLGDREDNRITLERLRKGDHGGIPNLAWVDACCRGKELPEKRGGVGMARKLGFDLAFCRLNLDQDPILIALDGDTIVRPDYLPAVLDHFMASPYGGAVIPFRHQETDMPQRQLAIHRYELFLRAYVLGLSLAGSPYAFHTVGSAMACRLSAYLKVGGMNVRNAGEDFYFLQQLYRTAGISEVKGTVVYPSPRPSHRVPFGTGRSVARLLSEEQDAVRFYPAPCFRILAGWLSLVEGHPDAPGDLLMRRAAKISPDLPHYLDGIDFPETWKRLQRNHPTQQFLLNAFHGWFDGLRTMKLIHYLTAGPFLRCEPECALPDLFRWAGLPPVSGIQDQLAILRSHQLGKLDVPLVPPVMVCSHVCP